MFRGKYCILNPRQLGRVLARRGHTVRHELLCTAVDRQLSISLILWRVSGLNCADFDVLVSKLAKAVLEARLAWRKTAQNRNLYAQESIAGIHSQAILIN